MNFAAVFHVPCVLVCQNNHWSISVPTSRQTASETLAVKGRAYGVPSVRVDGNDLLAMCKALGDAFAKARAGGGPTFIEAVTYRIGAHSTSDDPTRYRSDAEVESWKLKDPLDRLRKHLVVRGLLTDAKDAALETELQGEITPAIARVETLPQPERASLFEDVYAEPTWNLVEQRAKLRPIGAPGAASLRASAAFRGVDRGIAGRVRSAVRWRIAPSVGGRRRARRRTRHRPRRSRRPHRRPRRRARGRGRSFRCERRSTRPPRRTRTKRRWKRSRRRPRRYPQQARQWIAS